jgi:hypothetical protein
LAAVAEVPGRALPPLPDPQPTAWFADRLVRPGVSSGRTEHPRVEVVIESAVTQRLGALPVAAEFLRRLDVAGIVGGLRPPDSRADLTHGQVIEVLMANRLTAPAPLFRVGDWAYPCEAVRGLGGGRRVSRLVH